MLIPDDSGPISRQKFYPWFICPQQEIIAQRVRVLEKLQNGGGHCIVTTFEALSGGLHPSLFGAPLSYEQGQSIHREDW